MSSLSEQIEQLKERCLQNKHDSTILNEIIKQINAIQNNANAPDLTKALISLRKAILKHIIENDQCKTNACKRHLYITQTAGRPKKCIDKDVLEHMKT